MKHRVDPGEQGMILVNVLMFVAIASGLVLLMINREELALDRGLRTREAARALAVARGGELSAITALRAQAEKNQDEDYPAQGWGKVAENGVAIDGGSFDLAIGDAQSRFNVNMLRNGQAAPVLLFEEIAKSAGLTDDQAVEAIGFVRLHGPLTDLRPLRLAGLDPQAADRLEQLVTALPGKDTPVNLNSASPELMNLLFHNPVVVARLVAVRDRRFHLTLRDLTDAGVNMPYGGSFKSDNYWVRTRATIGGTSQQIATLLHRQMSRETGQVEVVPVERWRGAAVPPGVPEFSVPKQ